ncbi:MAG: nucleotidyltransferase family protein [Rhodospirillaceae bacterium]|nr:nucleotidyltransferase family protein [Rhodospirillaceae bacterium]
MKAMLLAAGRGVRMGPLTSELPKPLLSLGAETLIERHLRRLAAAGFGEVAINLSYRGEQIRCTIGDATPWGQTVVYSEEGEPPLETAGGIVHALPLLGEGPFVVVSTDVVTDYDFRALRAVGAELERGVEPEGGAELERRAEPERGAHLERAADLERTAGVSGFLVLVPNPPHNPHGDFGLTSEGRLRLPEAGYRTSEAGLRAPEGRPGAASPRYTFSGIAVFHPGLFRGLAPGIRPLRDVLRPAVRRGALLGEVFKGLWRDVGTPERLADARALVGGRRPRTSRETAG